MISVLAVDDNEVHCYAMMKLLERSGFKVNVAMTGRSAIETAKEQRPDVVLLDVNLPDVNGYEVCARLRNDPETNHIPIVFHTASSANEPARSYAMSVGGDAFLTYPIDREHLVSVINGCIAKHRD